MIDRALKKQPDKRYQTGEEFAQALIGVARELTDDERKKGSGRGISLSVRWALMMAALVAVTMTLTAAVLYQRQYTAMLDQVKSYGGSLAKLVATEMAVPLLSEDWAAIDVFIQETTSRQNFNHLLVIDYQGVVRGSNDPALLNAKYTPPDAKPMDSLRSGHRGAERASRRRPDRARFHGARPVPGQGDRQGAPRDLRSPAGRSRESHARSCSPS